MSLLESQRILVVDDNESAQFLIRKTLEAAGAHVEVVPGGADAIEAFTRVTSAGLRFAAIVLDVRMPVMDGPTTARQLRLLGFNGPIIGLTADVFGSEELRAPNGDFDEILFKPIDRGQLIRTIVEWISR